MSEQNKVEVKKQPMVRKSPEFKLKDKQGRNYVVINLMNFGFLPETIAIEKVAGQSNKFRVVAFLTKGEEEKELAKRKAKEEANKTITNSENNKDGTAQPSTK